MSVPKVEKEFVEKAFKYIDEHGIPSQNNSRSRDVIFNGKRYPPKYVLGVAKHLSDGSEIKTNGFDSGDAYNVLKRQGFDFIDKGKNYSEKENNDIRQTYINPYSPKLLESKNIIFRGAPGTGKSYLAKEIAADIVSNGTNTNYSTLNDEQKEQIEFVQFHPNYDYSDFVEGLRPRISDDGSMSFELQDGIFKKFINKAKKNYENSKKSKKTFEKELTVQEAMDEFFSNIKFGEQEFKIGSGNSFIILDLNETFIHISIPENKSVNRLTLRVEEIKEMLESEKKFNKVKDVQDYFNYPRGKHEYSYNLALYNEIQKYLKKYPKSNIKVEEQKNYVFIIDEINRGEISKIFGELFFSIDPDYRGRTGEVSTQYMNLHSNPEDKFFIPENVYIIGTMNDIDRSVDTFDFAMRRRFRFIEIKANDNLEMLNNLNNPELEAEAKKRLKDLNQAISVTEGLNNNYHIGPSYFLKLKDLNFDQLWTDYLKPLLQDYVQGMYDEEEIIDRFAKSYGYKEPLEGDISANS